MLLDGKEAGCIVDGGEFEIGVLLGAGGGISCVKEICEIGFLSGEGLEEMFQLKLDRGTESG